MTRSKPTLGISEPWNGKRIGLLGGSFNPAHAGHLHIANLALEHFGLDAVWWLVTPQNPLKDAKDASPYVERFFSVEEITRDEPGMIATHLEAELGTKYTFETVVELKKAFPKTDFLFICGMDNAVIFHKWDRWQELVQNIPVVFAARNQLDAPAQGSPLRHYEGVPHHETTQGAETDLAKPGIYWLRFSPEMNISSTEIRNNNR